MSIFPLDLALRRFIRHGRLTIIDTAGKAHSFGEGQPSATLRFHDAAFQWRLLRRPSIEAGDGYVDGAFTIEEGTLRSYLEIMLVSQERAQRTNKSGGLLLRVGNALRRRNTTNRSSRNVRHHYDIDHRLYELFLDSDLQYSCAYWRDGVTSLEEAQVAKKRHVAAKLLLAPGMRVLDIGSGWGGLALHLAREHGVEVTGITLSNDQYETSLRRAEQNGLSERVHFKLQDYRDEAGTYDRIVSVGMLEHVGRRNLPEFFRRINRLLKPDGVAVVHSIARMSPPGGVNPWMQKHIFPGGFLPSLSQLAPLIESEGFWLTDLEVLRLHYAKTLEAWDQRFQARRAEVAAMFDERFCRMWEFYLQSSEMSFRCRQQLVFQLQLAKEIGVVPITRDYLHGNEGIMAEPSAPETTSETAARSRREGRPRPPTRSVRESS